MTRGRVGQRRPVHLRAEVFAPMTDWISVHQRRAEQRFSRLDDLLAELSAEPADPDPDPGRPGSNLEQTRGPGGTMSDETYTRAVIVTDTDGAGGADHPRLHGHRRAVGCVRTPTPNCSAAGSAPRT